MDGSELEKKPEYHVYYEIGMLLMTLKELLTTYRPLEKVKGGTIEELRKNAFLESCLIHVRILANFLYGSCRTDDITAGDFFTSNKDYPLDKNSFCINGQDYDKFIEEINKQIAHVTLHRTQINQIKRDWPLGPIRTKLCEDLSQWINKADKIDNRIKGDIQALLKNGCGLLDETNNTEHNSKELEVGRQSNTTTAVSVHILGINSPEKDEFRLLSNVDR